MTSFGHLIAARWPPTWPIASATATAQVSESSSLLMPQSISTKENSRLSPERLCHFGPGASAAGGLLFGEDHEAVVRGVLRVLGGHVVGAGGLLVNENRPADSLGLEVGPDQVRVQAIVR